MGGARWIKKTCMYYKYYASGAKLHVQLKLEEVWSEHCQNTLYILRVWKLSDELLYTNVPAKVKKKNLQDSILSRNIGNIFTKGMK